MATKHDATVTQDVERGRHPATPHQTGTHSWAEQESRWCTASWRSRLSALTASRQSAASRPGSAAAKVAAVSSTGCRVVIQQPVSMLTRPSLKLQACLCNMLQLQAQSHAAKASR